jgi:hypothetical protein
MPIYHDDFTIRDVEVYARAVEDILDGFGIGGSGKSYDPLTIEQITTANGTKFVAHSYAFDLWDGGRHHYADSLAQIWQGIRDEAVRELKEHLADNSLHEQDLDLG